MTALLALARRLGALAWPLGATLALLLVWEALVRALGVRSILLPPPSEILEVIVLRYDLLLANLWPSLYMTVFGFLLSVVGGVFIAILITYSAIVRKVLYPIIVISQVVPKILDRTPPHRLVRHGRHLGPAACLPDRLLSHDDQRGGRLPGGRRGHPQDGARLHGLALARSSARSGCRTPCRISSAA